MSSASTDDSCLLGTLVEACRHNVETSIKLMDDLGFTVHPEKSSLEPSHILVYMGFILNSLVMTVTLLPILIALLPCARHCYISSAVQSDSWQKLLDHW